MRAVSACALAVRLLAGMLLVACRVVLVVVLRFLQPVLAGPLVVGCIGGVGATIGFAAMQMWSDALRAGVVTLASALVLGAYSATVIALGVEPTPVAYRPTLLDRGASEHADAC